MAKNKYGFPTRKGVNPALAQMAMEKKIETQLQEAYENGKKAGATNMSIAAAMVFPYIVGEAIFKDEDYNSTQVFYDMMKKAVMTGIPLDDDFPRMLDRVRTELGSNMTDEQLAELDVALAGHLPASPIEENGITVKNPFKKDA